MDLGRIFGNVVYIAFLFVFFNLVTFTESESPPRVRGPPSERFCNKTVSSRFFTTCKPCPANENTNCPYGTTKLTTGNGLSGCSYLLILMGHKMMLKGCRHQCIRHSTLKVCCPGFWGFQCQECPGGATLPCSGRGNCNDGSYGNGTCICDSNFGGVACEKCAHHYQYGPNCTGECRCLHGICVRGIIGDGTCFCDAGYTGRYCDVQIPRCDSIICHEHAECVEEDADHGAKCVCHLGYQSYVVGTKPSCEPIDPCDSNPCHANATCNMTGPGNHTCSCLPGYAGDGLVCQEVNPCQMAYGGCEMLSSTCVYDGPGKSHCECKDGYENFQLEDGCSLIDVCQQNLSLCHAGANCTTVAPGQFECKCREGYIGDGFTCYGNILQRLIDINILDANLTGKLDFFIKMVQELLAPTLTMHGPFTLFACIDEAFADIDVKDVFNYKPGVEINEHNREKVKELLKQHLIIGQFTLEQLANMSYFYTLQGSPGEVRFKGKEIDIYKYRIQGAHQKGLVLHSDILASNGLIHVIDKVMVKSPEVKGDKKKSLFANIQTDSRFNRFETLLKASGLSELLKTGGPYIVFAPNNGAWAALPEGTVDYLLTEEGKGRLISILSNHIVKGEAVLSEDLVNIQRFQTFGNNFVSVSITDLGQITLNDKVNITQTDIVAANGYIHHIDGVLTPMSIGDLLPNSCNDKTYQLVRGSCGPCHRERTCASPTDLLLNKTTTGCRYWVNLRYRYIAFMGCARLCNRTILNYKCCDGFYSNECLPCPGGFLKPCNGHGKCEDGYNGSGTCECDKGFTGRACHECVDKTKFGPNCEKKCTCIKGVCNSGINGNGRCKSGSCVGGYEGQNCQSQRIPCLFKGFNTVFRLKCHAHATCVQQPLPSSSSRFIQVWYQTGGPQMNCECNQGYKGDGIQRCVEIDPCKEKDRGGCHEQAECINTGPGLRNCVCSEGWVGDGTYCYPSTPCKVHNQCHPDAQCIDTSPGKFICKCKESFHGNGTYCVWDDMCTIKNGGCDGNALCIHTGPGTNNCTCKDGYHGDGKICLRTLLDEINSRTELQEAKNILATIPISDDYLTDPYSNFTVFIPTNDVLAKFKNRANNQYWVNPENVMKLLSYHTLKGKWLIEQLYVRSDFMYDVDTLLSGHALNITKKGNDYYVDKAIVINSNIAAINGFLHIIDKVLEPYPIAPDDQNPYLLDLLASQNLTQFREDLVDTGYINEIDRLEQDFTLFVPTNEALRHKKIHFSKRYMSSYLISEFVPSTLFYNNKSLRTMLMNQFRIDWTMDSKQTLVNDQRIVKADLLVDGGVIHVIDGIFQPVLNRCVGEKVKTVIPSKCVRCTADQLRTICPSGFKPITTIQMAFTLNCNDSRRYYPAASRMRGASCHFYCETMERVDLCCPSFYGLHCELCPGGMDYPCNGHGICDDGISGSGHCACFENFTGHACDICIKGKRGVNCSETITCNKNNGYCHKDAECSGPDMNVSCKCKAGFFGDGKNCTHWCQVNNGGCLSYASCGWDIKRDTVSCTCPSGMYGDGKAWCKLYTDRCKIQNGGCHVKANCTFTPPTDQDNPAGEVQCQCQDGYVGDGIQHCNADVYSAINTLQTLQTFSKMLKSSSEADPNVLDILNQLHNDTDLYTIFIPINFVAKVYTRNDVANLIVTDVVYLNSSINETTYQSMAGQPLTVRRNVENGTGVFHINDAKITTMNIPTTNGLLHYIDKPLLYPVPAEEPKPSTGRLSKDAMFLVKVVPGVVGGIALLAILIAVVAARMRRKSTASEEDTKNLIATYSKDGDEDFGFGTAEDEPSDDEKDTKTLKRRQSCEISYGHSFNNPLYETGAESTASSFPF